MKKKAKIEEHQSPSQFLFTLTRMAVAQICGSVGFKAAQTSALNALTDIAARHLQELAKSSATSANFFGRTHSNVFDIILALEDCCSVWGFRGASNFVTDLSPYASSTVKDIINFVDYSSEMPFAKPLPCDWSENRKEQFWQFPRRSKGEDSGVSGHIPKWLPPIPKEESVAAEKAEEEKWVFRESRFDVGAAQEKFELKEKKSSQNKLPMKRERVRFKIVAKGFVKDERGCVLRLGLDDDDL